MPGYDRKPNTKVPDGRYSVADYKSWTDGQRRELIDGVIYNMSPAPRIGHQELPGALYTSLRTFLEGKQCIPFLAPVDVYLSEEEDDEESDNVVQPDIMVVCDLSKIHDDGIHGSPDLVIEVLSPSTTHKDLGEKRNLYEQALVREYWLLNPDTGAALVWRLDGGRFMPLAEYTEGSQIDSSAIPGFIWKTIRARTYG